MLNEEYPDLPVTAVCGVHFKNDSVLLTRNNRGWDLTGGHVNAGETIEEALYREMQEEGGVLVSDFFLTGYFRVIYIDNTENLTTNKPYPTEAVIPVYVVTTDQPLVLATGEEVQGAEFHHIRSKTIQNFRFPRVIESIFNQNLFNG